MLRLTPTLEERKDVGWQSSSAAQEPGSRPGRLCSVPRKPVWFLPMLDGFGVGHAGLRTVPPKIWPWRLRVLCPDGVWLGAVRPVRAHLCLGCCLGPGTARARCEAPAGDARLGAHSVAEAVGRTTVGAVPPRLGRLSSAVRRVEGAARFRGSACVKGERLEPSSSHVDGLDQSRFQPH